MVCGGAIKIRVNWQVGKRAVVLTAANDGASSNVLHY